MESDSLVINYEEQNLNETEESEVTEGKQSNSKNISTSISLKKQPEHICNCPLHCDNKMNKEWKDKIYKQFHDLGDHALQNQYIQRHIKIKSIAKRLWEDEIIDKKIQRRVTCKYLIPLSGSVIESYSYAKTIDYDSVKYSLDLTSCQENGYKQELRKDASKSENFNVNTNAKEIQADDSTMDNVLCSDNSITANNFLNDSNVDNKRSENSFNKETISNVNSPASTNDNESINTLTDDMNGSELENSICFNSVKYVEVCQKAFMNMYGITEKRIRWQREKLILKSRYLAEKKKKELEEMDRTLSLARSLGVGCQPLFALLEKSNCTHLSGQLLGAIEDDVALVNNFFHNQLWKPEDMMNKSVYFSNLDSFETECD